MSRLRAFWRRLPPNLRAGVTSAWQAFVATTLVALLKVLGEVQSWFDGNEPPPDWSSLARVAGGAVIALATGIVATVYRTWRPPAMSYPDRELDPQDRR